MGFVNSGNLESTRKIFSVYLAAPRVASFQPSATPCTLTIPAPVGDQRLAGSALRARRSEGRIRQDRAMLLFRFIFRLAATARLPLFRASTEDQISQLLYASLSPIEMVNGRRPLR
jgi:hypothetical protein